MPSAYELAPGISKKVRSHRLLKPAVNDGHAVARIARSRGAGRCFRRCEGLRFDWEIFTMMGKSRCTLTVSSVPVHSLAFYGFSSLL